MLRIRFLLIKFVVLTFSVGLMTGPANAQAAYTQLVAFGDFDADFNGDSIVNAIDLGIFKSLFFMTPGPSATAP